MPVTVQKCALTDVDTLAMMNKQLIDDERSDNRMTLNELKARMTGFLSGSYDAYFFICGDAVVGYALVDRTRSPLFVRQFLIDRKYRQLRYGTHAFTALRRFLNTDTLDIEVLPWNEPGLKFWEHCGFVETCRSMRFSHQTPVKD